MGPQLPIFFVTISNQALLDRERYHSSIIKKIVSIKIKHRAYNFALVSDHTSFLIGIIFDKQKI